MSFEAWLVEVDRVLERIVLLSHRDLADQPYRDWYDDEVSPEEAVEMIAESEGFMELLDN